MATWSIVSQPHGKFVTCQRPIVIRTNVTAGAVAHFRGKLYIYDGGWSDTGVEFNGYSETGGNTFSFNVAEYTRHFFEEVEGFYNTAQMWCTDYSTMVERRFRVRIYPVEYDANSNLVPDPSDYIDTNDFYVVPLNTMAREATSSEGDNIRIDKFVTDSNNSSTATLGDFSTFRFMSNLPNLDVLENTPKKYFKNYIDISQGPFFYSSFLRRGSASTTLQSLFRNDSGSVTTITGTSNTTGFDYVHLHPVTITMLIELMTGAQSTLLLDASGNLTSKHVDIMHRFVDGGGNTVRKTPWIRYHYKESMGCDSTTFLFRNMRGAFDWFTATGTEEGSLELSGTEFDRHTDFYRADSDNKFGLIRGQHNNTNLWNSRKETFSVFSQPLSKEHAIYVEELISSPQAWIIRDIKDVFSTDDTINPDQPWAKKGLVAINIIKGSFKIYNTEKSRSFVEFKYTLSENTITQKM